MNGTFKVKSGELSLIRRRYSRWKGGLQGRSYTAILFAMCNGKCPECGTSMILSYDDSIHNRYNFSATIDHINDLKDTLEHSKVNLQIMCRSCNIKKANLTRNIIK